MHSRVYLNVRQVRATAAQHQGVSAAASCVSPRPRYVHICCVAAFAAQWSCFACDGENGGATSKNRPQKKAPRVGLWTDSMALMLDYLMAFNI